MHTVIDKTSNYSPVKTEPITDRCRIILTFITFSILADNTVRGRE